ncbi:MAG: hypothetical protein KKG47_06595 [Proteobacteria bacterium]|nr:hypothetical protein [Pseudomonadota bacterium]MBU1739758.1 hypothetical protein [Pseudomonadota bacterium]
MKFLLQPLAKTFADKFKWYSILIFLALAVVFLLTDETGHTPLHYSDQTVLHELNLQKETGRHRDKDAIPPSTIVEIPLVGKIDAKDYSLPVLAIALGLVDGLNPCAMWVLVYLISLVLSLEDRSRIWTIVGSFVFASGVLYFLFMTAWLNAYLFMGYVRQLTLLVGFFALWVGTVDLYESIKNRGRQTCEVVSPESRSKTMDRIRKVVLAPFSIGSLVAIISLAFVVNSIEFLCSAAIPAVFTYILSVSPLSTLQYYLYILLYDLFFMLDDLLIFSTAAFAATSSLGEKYAVYTKPIGGALMLGIGIVLIFFPNLLR